MLGVILGPQELGTSSISVFSELLVAGVDNLSRSWVFYKFVVHIRVFVQKTLLDHEVSIDIGVHPQEMLSSDFVPTLSGRVLLLNLE